MLVPLGNWSKRWAADIKERQKQETKHGG